MITAIAFLCGMLVFQDAPGGDAGKPWVVYPGGEGPGAGKHIVFVSGDEEYRSEECFPMLGRLLAKRHGFKCTVLFPINSESGEIDPNVQTNIPGLEALGTADMMVLALRFRELPDPQMKHFDEFVQSGKPIFGLRTSTHAFQYKRNKESPYARYHFSGGEWKNGFGGQVLGDTWLNHHGHHGQEATRGIINPEHKGHPILRGVTDVFGPTDVYGVRTLPEGTEVLLHGQVVAGMDPGDPAVEGKKNDPMMPLVWVRGFTGKSGKTSRVICTTMGASQDFLSEGLRRLTVNAIYWGCGLESKIPEKTDVRIVGDYAPTRFGFNAFTKGVKPADHR